MGTGCQTVFLPYNMIKTLLRSVTARREAQRAELEALDRALALLRVNGLVAADDPLWALRTRLARRVQRMGVPVPR